MAYVKTGGQGRPSHWKAEWGEMTFKLALLGYTNKQFAEFFKVSVKVIEDWVVNNRPFFENRNRGRDAADAKVAKSLYERALGYEYVETFTQYNPEGAVTRTEETKKKIHGDVNACLRWLAMRQRENWAQTAKSEHTVRYAGEVDLNVIQDKLKDQTQYSDADLEAALQFSIGKLKIPADGQNN